MLLISSYLPALFLTIAIELAVAFVFGFRKKTEMLAVIFVNLITNPVLNYFVIFGEHFSLFKINFTVTLLLEILVVLVEWRLLVYALREKSGKLLVLSFGMNLCSYIVGILALG